MHLLLFWDFWPRNANYICSQELIDQRSYKKIVLLTDDLFHCIIYFSFISNGISVSFIWNFSWYQWVATVWSMTPFYKLHFLGFLSCMLIQIIFTHECGKCQNFLTKNNNVELIWILWAYIILSHNLKMNKIHRLLSNLFVKEK